MIYGGRDCVYIIDGMDAVTAGYHFAGVVGISPRRWTLRQLWMMANGQIRNRRRQNLELSALVWGLSSIDWESYLLYGEMSETGRGGPVAVSPAVQAQIDDEVERIRRENPQLPAFKAADGR